MHGLVVVMRFERIMKCIVIRGNWGFSKGSMEWTSGILDSTHTIDLDVYAYIQTLDYSSPLV